MRWLLLVLLVSSIARAQETIPCRRTSIGFACPGDRVCNTELLQCIAPCEPSKGPLACPGNLICKARRCVEAPTVPQSKWMRNFGIGLTVPGSGLFVTAIVFFVRSHSCGPPLPLFIRFDDDCQRGYEFLSGGSALLGIGIPFWAVGQHWLNRYPQRAELFITPVDGGAVAGVRLVSF